MKYVLIPFFVLLCFSAEAFTFEAPEIPGWEQDGDVQVFGKSDLFNHIDGASEFYLSYNFQKLWVVRYKKGDAELTLEVYDHGNKEYAFGIYSMERPPEVEVKDIGIQGYYENAILNFVIGRYYVKMNSFREPNAGSGVLLSTANEVSDMLSNDSKLPRLIKVMPEENLVPNSRQFVSNNFMGFEFLGSAYRGSYKTDDGELTMFIMERDSREDIESLLKKYYEFVQAKADNLTEGNYVIDDPFNGTVYLTWTDHYLIGFSGDNLNALREQLLRKATDGLGI